MKEFKIRCSAIGSITTNAKKKGELSKGAQTYCKEWVKEQIYDRRKEFTSKYTDKGNIAEDDSLDFAAKILDMGMLIKNEQFHDNDFITGTPDAVTSDLIIDVKSSWDFTTFPLFEDAIPKKDYWWQLQGYMALTGKRKAKLVYTLMDTPAHLIEREAYFWCKNNGYDELDMSIYEQFYKRMTYDTIPDKYRIKIYDVEYDAEAVEAIKVRVGECREFISTLI